MMKMMRLTQALVLLCCVSVAFGATRVILDGFTEKQNLIVDLAPPYPTISRSSVSGTMLGGERDSALFGVSGLEGIQVSSQVIAGSWFLACQRTADCKGSLTYDGKDASPNINFSGLGSIDFTNNGANALTLTVQTDIDTFYNLTFYQSGTSGAKFATARFATLTGPAQQYLVPFTSFTSSTGMDFSKVGSYVLFAEGGADVDSTASLFATFANDISGNVFRDCNINGVKDSGETSITGVNVTLYDSSTRLPIKSAFTDASGNYILPTVPGSYFVCAAPSIGIPTTPATNCTGTINVVIGVDYTNNNFGFTIPVTVTPPADRTVNCSASTAPANTGTATGTGCSTPTITFSDSETSTCNGRKTITRTWTATLGADSASRVQIITTFDNTVPIFTNFPTNKTVVCTGSTDTSPASQGTPAATDNCSSALITSIDIASAGGCTAPLIRTWTATDDCGNAVSRNQSITVTDTTAPVVDFFPPSYSTSCTGDVSPASAGIPTISDVCSGVQIPTSTDSGVTGTCTKTFTRTWTMRDTCGNTVTRPQTISRVDGDSPSFVNFPQDVTRQCGASTTPANTGGAPTGTDPCNNGATVTFTDTSAPGTCGSIITRTWRVADSCGNFITQVQTITVTDSAAPTLTTVSGRTIGCSAATTVAALGNTTVTDCTPNPVLTITDATFGNSCVGGFVRTFSASDNCGNTNSTTQTVNVVDVVAPVVTFFPANFSISCNGDSTPENNGGVPAYTDACNGVVDPTFTDGSPTGSPCNVTTLRTWKMADACGNTVQRVQAFFKADLTAPSLTATPADITIECGSDNSTASTEFPTAAAIDDCSTVSKSFSDVTTGPVCNRLITRTFRFLDQCSRSITYAQKINVTDTTKPTFIFRPRDLTIGCTVNSQVLSNTNGSAVAVDSCTAVTITRVDVNSTLACGTLITRTWRAQDACGNFDTFDQSITVTDNINPVFVTFPADRNLNCSASIDSAVQGVPTASDSCSGVQAITFIDNDNQNTCNRVINRTFTVSDNCGNTISRSQILRLTDTTAPFFDQFPAAASVPCDGSTDPSNFATPTVFADDCNVAQTITSGDVGPTGNTCTKTLTRTFTASDDCGNKRTRSQVITVTDNTQPILSDTPQNIDLECGSSTNVNDLGRPTSFDSCGTFPVTFTDRSTGDSCDRTITRTFSVTDGCTTAVTSVQVITVSDNFAPVLTNSPADIQLECGSSTAVGTLGRPTATDACNAATTTLTSADVTTTIDACTRQIVRTFTTNDGCGNIATSTQTITLVDSTKPVFDANFPADTVLECGSTLPVTAPTAKDNCNTVTVTKTDFTDGAGCEEPVTRTWRAQDACGNFVERDQLITLRDRTPPVFVGFPSTITIDCEADIDDLTITGAAPTGTDSCSGVNDPTYTDVDTATGCNAQVTRTWVLTDTCGNSVRQDQIIRIRDTTKPSFDTFPDDVSRDCADGSSTSPDSTGTPTGVDDCQTPSITSSDRSTGINCPTTSEIIRTWTIRDGCGNSDTRDQRITLTLSQPPVLTVPPQITVECGTSVLPAVTGTATATSSCGVRFNITYVDNADEGICPKTLIRTWTVTDICGNTDSDTQTILQTDTTKPVFISFPSDKTVGCEDNTDPSVTGAPTAADNCDDSLCQRLTYNDVQSTGPTTGTCTPDLIIDRTWTIVDQCDNSFSRTQRITVKYVRFSGNCTQTNCPADPCTDAECAALGSSSCNCCAADRSCNAVPCTAVPCTSVTCKPVACTCPTSTAAVDFCDDSLDVPCVPQVVYVLRSGGSPSSGNSPSSNNSPSSGNNKSSSSASTLFSYFSLFLFALIFLFKF